MYGTWAFQLRYNPVMSDVTKNAVGYRTGRFVGGRTAIAARLSGAAQVGGCEVVERKARLDHSANGAGSRSVRAAGGRGRIAAVEWPRSFLRGGCRGHAENPDRECPSQAERTTRRRSAASRLGHGEPGDRERIPPNVAIVQPSLILHEATRDLAIVPTHFLPIASDKLASNRTKDSAVN